MRLFAIALVALCAMSAVEADTMGSHSLGSGESSKKVSTKVSVGATELAITTRHHDEAQAVRTAKRREEEAAKRSESAGEAEKEEKSRPFFVPFGHNWVVFSLQLTGVSAETVLAKEDAVKAAISQSFEEAFEISAGRVEVEAAADLVPAGTAALLEVDAAGTQLACSARIRVTCDEDDVVGVKNEIKTMVSGGTLQAHLTAHGLTAQVALRGETEVVSSPQGPDFSSPAPALTSTTLAALVAFAAVAFARN